MTYLEKAKLEQPDRYSVFSASLIEDCTIGCPYSWGLVESKRCPVVYEPDGCRFMTCKECWNREVPETKEKVPETKEKEKEKEIITMKDILEILRTSVADYVSYDDIKAAIVSYIEDHDFSYEVDSLVRDAVSEDIGDYISDALADIVKDEVRCTIEDMFN